MGYCGQANLQMHNKEMYLVPRDFASEEHNIDEDEYGQDRQPGEGCHADHLPQEADAEDDAEDGEPRRVYPEEHLLHLLGVDRHQVHHFADALSVSRDAGES